MPEKLKKGWTRVAFGDVVQLCRKRSSNPIEDGFDRYVGLEHLEPGDLKIRRWGNVADGTTFTNVFRSGQVLFGKRRAYQRKVALADFDGVCSGDIYVFKPKNENLLPKLLPFICQTDAFFEHAVGTSAGSLSPRTNWESLASYEFALPPLEEQRRIAEVLGASRRCVDTLYTSITKTHQLMKAALLGVFDTGADPRHSPVHRRWNCYLLRDYISVKHGWAFKGEFFSDDDKGPLLLTPSNFTEYGHFDFGPDRNKYYTSSFPEEYRLAEGDLLLLMTDLTPSARLLGAPGMIEAGQAALHNQRLGKVILNNQAICDSVLFNRYLFLFFLGEPFRRQIRSLCSGSTVNHTSPSQICSVSIPMPDEAEMRSVVVQLWGIWLIIDVMRERWFQARSLASQMFNEVLGGFT